MYNANNAKEVENTTKLPKDTILNGVIISIDDGKVKDYLPDSAKEKWKGDLDSNAINCTIEVAIDDMHTETITQIFPYIDNNGTTEYKENSNLSKFKKKYEGKLPQPGLKVKVITNGEGFGKLKLE